MSGQENLDDSLNHSGSILVVDDNGVNVSILTRLLNRHGYHAIGVQSGKDALIQVEENDIELILLDLFMPGMSGFEVCEAIKSDANNARIPIIFISANEDTEYKVRAFQLGAVDFMSKPYHVQEVLARVKMQLTIFRQQREIDRLRAIDQQRLQELAEDIARREAIETELRLSEQRFEQLVNAIQEVFWLIDIHTQKFIYLSPVFERWGYDPQPYYENGWRIKELFHPDDWERLNFDPDGNNIQTLIELAKSSGITMRILRNGKTFWVRTRLFPVFDDEGKLYRLAGIAEDVTERKAVDEKKASIELQQQRVNLLLDFFTNVSHEFRTPLSIIQTRSYLLKRAENTDEAMVKHLDVIEEQVNAITDLIDSLGWMTRLDSGQIFDFTPIDVNRTLLYLQEIYRSWGKRKQITVTFNHLEYPLEVHAENGILRRLFDEIVENAIQFSPEKGTVDIALTANGSHIYATITDSGDGVPEDIKERIFERFYRMDESRTTRGFGLGLAIARKIANLLGGDIVVENTETQGARFTVSLPLASE